MNVLKKLYNILKHEKSIHYFRNMIFCIFTYEFIQGKLAPLTLSGDRFQLKRENDKTFIFITN